MDPVDVGKNLDIISMDAAGIIPFGSAVVKSASGTIAAAITANDNDIIGFAKGDELEHTVAGFYGQYDPVPVIVGGGRVNAWVIANGTDVNIIAGDFLDVAALGSTPTGPHGLLEESGNVTGGTRVTSSVAKAVESKTMGSASYKIPASDVAIADTTVTFSSANLTLLSLVDGDYFLMEDLSGNLQVNRQNSATSTVITLEKASTIAMVATDSDLVTKMFQVEAMIL